MKSRSLLRRTREVALTLGAVAGSLCLLMLVLGAVADVRPLVFRSGSMAPAIDTGDLAVVRTVSAGDLETGDIVSVMNAQGDRVTHRLVRAVPRGDRYDLTLQGDANPGPDAETYTVSNAEKVEFAVPALGRVIAAMSSPGGLVVAGGLGVLLVGIVLRGPRDPRGKRRNPTHRKESGRDKTTSRARVALRVVVSLCTPLILTCSGGAWAAPWTDAVTWQAGASSQSVASQATPVCDNINGLLVLGNIARLTWSNVDARYEYVWSLQQLNGNVVVSGVVPSSAQSQGSAVSVDISTGLIGTNADYNVVVRARLKASPTWTAATTTSSPVHRESILIIGAAMRCGYK